MKDCIFWAIAINGTCVGPFNSRHDASLYIDAKTESRWIVAPNYLKDDLSNSRKNEYYKFGN